MWRYWSHSIGGGGGRCVEKKEVGIRKSESYGGRGGELRPGFITSGRRCSGSEFVWWSGRGV